MRRKKLREGLLLALGDMVTVFGDVRFRG